MQAAAGGASEAERREMATVVQAKEAALKSATKLQAEASQLTERMQGLQSRARALQQQLEEQGEQLRP